MFKPRAGVLIVTKQDNSSLSVDMVISELEEDKNLITCLVTTGNEQYPDGASVIVWKYALYKLVYQGADYFFVENEDVVAQIQNV